MVKEAIDSYIKADDPSAYTEVVDAAKSSGFYFIFYNFSLESKAIRLYHKFDYLEFEINDSGYVSKWKLNSVTMEPR